MESLYQMVFYLAKDISTPISDIWNMEVMDALIFSHLSIKHNKAIADAEKKAMDEAKRGKRR